METPREDFITFFKKTSERFFRGLFNIFIFLPYYFSVIQLSKTLFHPWKQLITVKKRAGFSFEEWAGRMSFNMISSGIGLVMRIAVLVIYMSVQMVFVFSLPFIILFFFISIPFTYILYSLRKPDSERKEILMKDFLAKRLLSQENKQAVEKWFETYYTTYIHRSAWWELYALFSIPPVGRDWSMGYTPTVDQYVEELTKPKRHFRELVNREKEIHHLALALSKSEEANVVIVGNEGVGKHTIIEALAKRIYEGKINPILAYKRILKINIEQIISQSVDASQKETLLKNIFQEAEAASNIIICIDNFEKYISGVSSDRIDLTTTIAPYARSGRLQFIAVTTPFFYQKFMIANETMHRLFEKIDVYEIGIPEAMEVLMKAAFEMESRFQLIIPYETIKESIEKSNFYITTIPFPEKALSLLDESCVYFKSIQKKDQHANQKNTPTITTDIIDTVLTKKTHIPVRLDSAFKEKLLNLESLLSEHIIAQSESIAQLASTLRKSFTLVSLRKKPLASFLFLGPTGVGKTETAKALTSVFFGSPTYLIRLDMSFYQSINDIPALIGSMNTGNPGILTAAVRERPYGVLLLDEIEKTHPDLINIFLTVLDEGYFTDGYGKQVDCKNLMVIATSNAGADMIFQQSAEQEAKETITSLQRQLINYLVKNRIFTPEFLNRFDGVILYHTLTKEALLMLAKKMLISIGRDIYRMHGITVRITEEFIHPLIEKGYDPRFGARHLARVIRDEVEDKIAQMVLGNKVVKGETITF